jgi:hypothetical protein
MKDGYVIKNKSMPKTSGEDLELINKLTRRKFAEEEVYIFSVVLCDNDIDRENERFTDNALEKLAELYVGKTGILDHNPTSENQTARIYTCAVEAVDGKTNRLKDPYKRLVAKAYMPRSDKNKDIILEIDSGIKKEVSVGCSIAEKICSICGKDVKSESCTHIKNHRYKKDGIYQLCHTILDNPTDAYEWSFVAVPAQREAGIIKAFIPNGNGGDIKMEDIVKSLGSGQNITLSESESAQLFDLIKNLEEKASVGDFYKEELKSEVIKLSAIVQPEISLSLMKSVVGKLSIEELKSFKNSFKAKLSSIIPAKPQFTPEKTELPKNQNTQFKI